MSLPYISLILMITVCSISNASADQRLTFGVKLLGANWSGENGAGGTNFESDDGGQFAISLSYKIDRFFTGLNIQRGEYGFKGDAPDRFTVSGRTASTDVQIEQTDIDLLFGYYFWPQVSLFIDLKSVSNNWLNEPYQQNFVGLGLGVSGFIPINNKWTLFGSFGFIGNSDLKDDNDNKVGEGQSWALEFGSVYTLSEDHYFNAGVKTRHYRYEFLDDSKQDYRINAIFVGYNYSFSL